MNNDMSEQRGGTPPEGIWQRVFEQNIAATGLDHDVINGWLTLSVAVQLGDPTFADPVMSYAERVKMSRQNDATAEYIINHSDPSKVAAHDALAAEFNKDRERIIRENDLEALSRFMRRAQELIQGKK